MDWAEHELDQILGRDAQLGHRYRLERFLRAGGMSRVYVAYDTLQNRPVAVKFLKPDLLDDASICRFFLEARTALVLSKTKPVVPVRGVGLTDVGVPYLIMDLLKGEDLATRLRRRKKLPVGEAVRIVVDVCSAVQSLHEVGIVHRDIKPSNIFLVQEGARPSVRLLDLGIARPVARVNDISLTQSGELLGTLAYVPPERLRDPDDVSTEGDVWAIAVVLYQLVTGRLPFGGTSHDELLASISRGHLEPLSKLCDTELYELDTVVQLALHKSKAYRYHCASAFASALRAATGMEAEHPAVARPFTPPVHGVGPGTVQDGRVASSLRRRARAWALGLAALCPLAIAFWRLQSSEAPVPAPSVSKVSPPVAGPFAPREEPMQKRQPTIVAPRPSEEPVTLSSTLPSSPESERIPIRTPAPRTATDTPARRTPRRQEPAVRPAPSARQAILEKPQLTSALAPP